MQLSKKIRNESGESKCQLTVSRINFKTDFSYVINMSSDERITFLRFVTNRSIV